MRKLFLSLCFCLFATNALAARFPNIEVISSYGSTGNIGVGTSVPTQKIEVIGTVKATQFLGDGSQLSNLPASGITSIGTTTPTSLTGWLRGNGATVEADASIYLTTELDPVFSAWDGSTGINWDAFPNTPGYITETDWSEGTTSNMTGINWDNFALLESIIAYSAGTGISVGTTGVITNTAPDQTVTIGTTGTGLAITGTYPNFTAQNTAPYSIPSLATVVGIGSTAPSISIGTVSASSYVGIGTTAFGGATPSLATVVGIGSTAPSVSIGTVNVSTGNLLVPSGNIGVNSATPSQKVDVIGTVKATAFIGNGDGMTGNPATAYTDRLKWDGGNVGINTTTAAATLGLGSAAYSATSAFLPAGDVTLGTGTSGNYVSGVTANGLITMTGTEGATLGLTPCTGNENYIPKWNAATGWTCQADASGGYTNLTEFVGQNNWKVFYSDGSGDVKELALGAANTVLTSAGATSAPSFQAASGGLSGLTAGYHARATSASTLGNGLIYDNGTNVGIGSTAPQAKLDIEGAVYVGNGNIGVGSAVPSQKIDVSGTVKATAFQGDGSGMSGVITSNPSLSTVVGIGSTAPAVSIGTVSATSYVGVGTTGFQQTLVSATNIKTINSSSILGAGDLAVTGSQWTTFGLNVYYSGGNVGVGTYDPLGSMEVKGYFYADYLNGDGTGIYNIPFGSIQNFPTWVMGVEQDGNQGGVSLSGFNNDIGFITLAEVPSGISGLTPGYHTKALTSTTIGNSVIYDNGTNIGIGSTVPQAKLDVEGSVYFGNGNIGVGSSAPGQKIDVVGTVKATEISAESYVGIGTTAFGGATPSLDDVLGVGTTSALGISVGTVSADSYVGIGTTAFGGGEGTNYWAQGDIGINTTVNVGLGSASPSQKLDVAGTVKASGFSGRVVKRITTASDATSITPNSDNEDITYQLNTQGAGTLTINHDAGSPVNGQSWVFKIKSTNVQTFAWNASYVGGVIPLPTATTGGGKIDYDAFIYDSSAPGWDYTGNASGY